MSLTIKTAQLRNHNHHLNTYRQYPVVSPALYKEYQLPSHSY